MYKKKLKHLRNFRKKFKLQRKCPNCGHFIPEYEKGVFCSEYCRKEYNKKRRINYNENNIRYCANCGKKINEDIEGSFCSEECRIGYNRKARKHKDPINFMFLIPAKIFQRANPLKRLF